MDISNSIKAKSDQLNADDLIGGSIIVAINGVVRGSADQPVIINITGDHEPWKPSKTSLRVLAACWGLDTSKWIGQIVELYCETSVKWAGKSVGGIRTKSVSGIPSAITIMTATTRGNKAPSTVHPVTKIESLEQFNALDRDQKLKHYNYLGSELKLEIKSNSKKVNN